MFGTKMDADLKNKGNGTAWLTALLLGASVLAQLGGESVLRVLQWESEWLAAGEFWRLLTGHLAHWSWDHWIWDAMSVGVLGCFLEGRGWRRGMGVMLAAVVLATEGLLRMSENFVAYRGLSGIAVGLFAMAVGELFRVGVREGSAGMRWIGLFAGVGLVTKVCVEYFFGVAVFADATGSGYMVAVEAHLAGVIGAVAGGLFQFFSRRERPGRNCFC